MPTVEYDIYSLSYSRKHPVYHCYNSEIARSFAKRKGWKVVKKVLTDNGWKSIKMNKKGELVE